MVAGESGSRLNSGSIVLLSGDKTIQVVLPTFDASMILPERGR